ncbi:MAG: hypothetical protein ABT15_01640 [Pseudonocardia sp. SCN 73-27]|nr:MAG: hypothetical protein ABS80_04250 [Pseudonocardia sp. SCN 72-51]ODV08970.1 MAG: hypothetical protein ABT15_01640 [Pseudonocardia sp. SCN 73-27]
MPIPAPYLHFHPDSGPTAYAAREGADLRAPVQALLMVLTGRVAPALPQLTGPGVERLGAD